MTQEIEKIVNRAFGVDLRTKSRVQIYVLARSAYYNILKELIQYITLEEIARTIGVDHATIINSLKKTEVYKKFPGYKRSYNKARRESIALAEGAEDCSIDIELLALKIRVENLEQDNEKLKSIVDKMPSQMVDLIMQLKPEKVDEFIEYRMKPFVRMNIGK